MELPDFISADDHVVERPEVWTQRLSKSRWGDRIPHVERQADGTDGWVIDGQKFPLANIDLTAAILEDSRVERWEEMPKAVYEPRERLKAMDADGVGYSVLYPTVAGLAGETFGRLEDPELELACVRAYNDWLIEEWSDVSKRFVPQCIAPISSLEAAVKEIQRAVAQGHRGVVYPASPMELRHVSHINEPHYDPLWAICEDLGVPICFHAGASAEIQVPPYEGFSAAMAKAFAAITRPVSTVAVVVNFLLSRILLRFPRLQVVFAESALGWGAYLLEFTDHQFEADGLSREGYGLKPSEIFKRQCYLTAWYDRASLRTRHHIGTSNILWATDFPLGTSTWPDTQGYISRGFEEVPEEERRKMLWENAAQVYGLQDQK